MFWVVQGGSLNKNIQLMSVFLKAYCCVLCFWYHTLMTFLMMMSFVILPSVLMILLSTLSVIKSQIRDNNQAWPLNCNWVWKTLWTVAGSGLLISLLQKFNLFHLTSQKTVVLLMWKLMDPIFKMLSFRMLGLSSYWGLSHCFYW